MGKSRILFSPKENLNRVKKKNKIVLRDVIVTITEKLEALELGAYLSE